MIDKGKLYRFTESLFPPILWHGLKKTRGYQSISRLINNFVSKPHIENVTITEGDFANITLRLNPKGNWQKEMLFGSYDKELFSFLKSYNLKNGVMYDIGAHIGFHSLAFAKLVGETGKVFTFEPNPVNVTRIKEIFSLNQRLAERISLHEIALGEKTGKIKFLCTNDLEGGTSSGGFIENASTIWERSVYINQMAFKELEVPEHTIDNLIASKTILPPSILKIDVEGAEQLVLTGARETLKTYHPTIIVEFHSTYSAYACMKILNEFRYKETLLKQEPDGRILLAAVANE